MIDAYTHLYTVASVSIAWNLIFVGFVILHIIRRVPREIDWTTLKRHASK